MKLNHAILKSPIGELGIIFDDEDILYALSFENRFTPKERAKLEKNLGSIEFVNVPLSKGLLACFNGYFAGKTDAFDKVETRPFGTQFQIAAWRALQTIPYGKTASYGDQAKKIGNPKAVRAVGGANNKNPIAIVIPCHRVIGANGKMVGFGGGIATKEWLLAHEAKHAL